MSSTTDPGHRTAADIERDVERTRDSLRDTLEALRDRASPGQIFEQVMDYAKESGAPEMMRNMGRAMRDNPMPLMLVGAGLAWLMFSGSPRRGDNRARHYGRDDDHDRGRRRMAQTAHEDEGMVSRASQAVGEAASSVRDTVSDAAHQAGEMASGVMDSARDTAGQVGEMASAAYRRVTDAASSAPGMSDMTEGARRYAMDARDQADRGMRWMLDEQPLLLGALGLALGAAAGALIPGTGMEDRWMGEAREELMGAARETAEDAYEGAKDKAQGLMGEAGTAGGGIAETVRNAAHESVSQAAKDMADQAKSALHEAGRTEEPHRPADAPGQTANRGQPARPGGAR